LCGAKHEDLHVRHCGRRELHHLGHGNRQFGRDWLGLDGSPSRGFLIRGSAPGPLPSSWSPRDAGICSYRRAWGGSYRSGCRGRPLEQSKEICSAFHAVRLAPGRGRPSLVSLVCGLSARALIAVRSSVARVLLEGCAAATAPRAAIKRTRGRSSLASLVAAPARSPKRR
jgi:hypothetical protein